LIEKPLEFGSVPASARGLLLIDALATSCFERLLLDGGVLILGRRSGVADLHCSNVSLIPAFFAELLVRATVSERCSTQLYTSELLIHT
jgi:hypothetical protein